MSQIPNENRTLFLKRLAQLQVEMREHGDLPSLSDSVQRIHTAMRNPEATPEELASAVLLDVSLAKRVLMLANSAMYRSFGGTVTTVTQALHVLGTNVVGHLATSLRVVSHFDSVADGTGHAPAKAELALATAASTISRSVAAAISPDDCESVSLSALLSHMGWLLVNCYLPALAEEVREEARQEGRSTTQVSELLILGAPAWRFGEAAARHWGMPVSLIRAMNPESADRSDHEVWASQVGLFSRQFAVLSGGSAQPAELFALAKTYAERLGCDAQTLLDAATKATAANDAQWWMSAVTHTLDVLAPAVRPDDSSEKLRQASEQLAQMCNSMNTAQTVSATVELINSSMGFHRGLFFLRNAQTGTYSVRLALGAGAAKGGSLSFQEAFSPDVFHLALKNRRITYLHDAQSPDIRKHMPKWFLDQMGGVKSFLLIPIHTSEKAVGLLYFDWAENRQKCAPSEDDVAELNVLRGVIASAFQRAADASRAALALRQAA